MPDRERGAGAMNSIVGIEVKRAGTQRVLHPVIAGIG
jgi:hypothetical protein